MFMEDVVPSNSRYIPLTQQPACCVPTCFQIIMYKHNIPLIPAEKIGYYLGLIVHPDRKKLFYNVRTSPNKPSAGYGTRIYDPKFEPNNAFRKLGIPLVFEKKLINEFSSPSEILDYLKNTEDKDKDVLLCFNHGVLVNDLSKNWGHVCVFDRIIDGKIRIIDPSPDQPKWKLTTIEKMFDAMKKHGEQKSAGFWEISFNKNK